MNFFSLLFLQRSLKKALCTFFLFQCVLTAWGDPKPFVDGDRWCVLGDSITHGGSYHKDVELFYLTRFPERKIEVINCGIGGDTATGALKRLNWDCLDSKPTVVSVMLGMNDVGRDLYKGGNASTNVIKQRADRDLAYDKAMHSITQRLIASGAAVILIRPSPFDDTVVFASTNKEPISPLGCGEALRGYAGKVAAMAAEFKVPTVDFNGPLTSINAEQQKSNPSFTIIGPDRVHPGDIGHFVMAYEFLHAQKLSSPVSFVSLDGKEGKVLSETNCKVSDLTVTPKNLSFTLLENSLPYPVDHGAQPALKFVPFQDEFNREILQVSGLPAQKYQLSIDGHPIRSYTAAELAKGVNLSEETATPQYQQALAVREELNKKWAAVSKIRTIAFGEHWAAPEAAHPVNASELIEKFKARLAHETAAGSPYKNYFAMNQKAYIEVKPHEEEFHQQVKNSVDAARALAQPKAHHFVLESSDGTTH